MVVVVVFEETNKKENKNHLSCPFETKEERVWNDDDVRSSNESNSRMEAGEKCIFAPK